MSLIVEFTVPADAFALGRTLQRVSGVTVEIERLATHSREWVMPFMWVAGDDIDAFERGVMDDPTVEELHAVDEAPDLRLYSVHWSEDVEDLIDTIVDQHGIIQEAEATDGEWFLKLRFVNQERLESFQEYFHSREFGFEIHRLHDSGGQKQREYDLTPEQREVMVLALERGYFAVPRESQIADLAAELGISTNAVSQRLRRATANLTRNTLAGPSPRE